MVYVRMKSASSSRPTKNGSHGKRTANANPTASNSASNSASKKRKVNGAKVLPPVGSLVYRPSGWNSYESHRRAHGKHVAMVLRHGKDAEGPFAEAQEMLLSSVSHRFITAVDLGEMLDYAEKHNRLDNNNWNNNSTGIELALAPVAVNPGKKTVILRTAADGPAYVGKLYVVQRKRKRANGQSTTRSMIRSIWRPLAHGQKVYDVRRISSKTRETLAEVRRRAALRTIAKFRAGKRKAMDDAEVRAAVESPHKYYVSAHGRLEGSLFTVPAGICIVFVTSPGATCWSARSLTSRTAEQLVLAGNGDRYSAPYFAGMSAPDHSLTFPLPSKNSKGVVRNEAHGIHEIPYFSNLYTDTNRNHTYNPFGHDNEFEALLTGSNRRTTLHQLAHFVAKYRKKSNQPTVLIMGICRPMKNNSLFLREEFERNEQGRRRVGALSVKYPNTLTNAKRIGESFYLRQMIHRNVLNWVEKSGGVI